MDFDGKESANSGSEGESAMFGGAPIWERNRKRRGFGAKRPTEPRTFAPVEDEPAMTLDRPIERTPVEPPTAAAASYPSATVTNSTLAADEGALVAPIGRERLTRSSTRGTGGAAALIVGGVVVAAALAGTGWYAMRGHEGVPELTPGAAGSPSTSQVATAPLTVSPAPPQAAEPAQLAAATPAPAAAKSAGPPHERVQVASARHVRSAPARSAESSAVSASARTSLPDTPQPYSATTPQATPAAPPPPVQQAAPSAPESIPSTPPISPSPSPSPAQAQPPEPAPTPPTTPN
jgi:hypothetical protein